jgi:hypothetical protein
MLGSAAAPTLGAWESWPLVARRKLHEEDLEVKTEVIGYPGILMVHFQGESDQGMELEFWEVGQGQLIKSSY